MAYTFVYPYFIPDYWLNKTLKKWNTGKWFTEILLLKHSFEYELCSIRNVFSENWVKIMSLWCLYACDFMMSLNVGYYEMG